MRWPYPTHVWRLLRPLHHCRPTMKFLSSLSYLKQLPVCGLMVAIVLLSTGHLEAIPGITLSATRRCAQFRRKWPCLPHQKHSVALRAGRLLVDLSGVVSSSSNRQVRASTAHTRLSFPAAAFSLVRYRLSPTSVTSSAEFSASWRTFTRVVGSCRRSSLWRSLDATPQIKRATNSFSDFPSRRPNSATCCAKSQIDWFFRCLRPLNRTASHIRGSLGSRCPDHGVSAHPSRCPKGCLVGRVLIEQRHSLTARGWRLDARTGECQGWALTGVCDSCHYKFPDRPPL
ncbi:hypothetical protein T10_9274 [Trichinella papuae]|uniref:Uncharacterized protein n=1 Tax=Trichinella papuae TaxID=268474 RepID=A0A0V1MD14_9BILA|nr:hypothetical protein T10_9274 [Trichinella papuae]